MPDFSKHSDTLAALTAAQDADKDNREKAREAHLFIDKKDGQWEPYWWNLSSGKPRYTFDMTGPIIDQIAGEMEQADFDIKIRPAGGDATKDTAKTLDGLIRNIENISNAKQIFNHAGRGMVTAGIDGWRVVQRFADDNSFDQDLVIEPIHNFVDRAWLDPGSELQDGSDSKYGFLLHSVMREDYVERFPEGSAMSVGDARDSNAYYHKKDDIIVGQLYYIKEEARDLHLMSDGKILEDNDDFAKIKDELEAAGITIERTRSRKKKKVFSRLFDGKDWLTPEQETVFNYIPIIPTYANFKVFENKIIYRGVTEKLMDPQRVLNYSQSREIEEGALAPRAKYWMTKTQAEGHENELSTLNTNNDPVQFFNVDTELPGAPQQNGGAQINPGLRTISETMKATIGQSAGMFAANMGANPGLQSGIAIEKLQNKGDTGTIKFFSAQEVAICHTARIIKDAIPKVYDTKRQVRILAEDGSFSMAMLNDVVKDEETQELVKINDLSKGIYDVTCSAGPAFQNRQQETVSTIVEVAALDPSVITTGADVLYNNMTAPGMDLIADRKRQELFRAGLIPADQWTEEEKKIAQAQAQQEQQQAKKPSPEEMIGQAELITAQNEQAKTQISVQEKSANIQLASRKQQLEEAKFRQGTQTDNAKLAQTSQQTRFNQAQSIQKMEMEQAEFMAEMRQNQIENAKILAETMKVIREASGVDAIMGPGVVENFKEQSDLVSEAQDDL